MPVYDNDHDAKTLGLLGLATGTADGLIEASEQQGQSALVNSSDLPSDIRNSTKEEIEEKTGIVFAEDVNDLFVRVSLPEGWKLKPSDHSMWSYLHDDKGRSRASIFYKAAFYDRSAHIRFEEFWKVRMNYADNGDVTYWVQNAEGQKFAEQPICRSPKEGASPEERRSYFAEQDRANAACKEWLAENAPDYESPFAYWA